MTVASSLCQKVASATSWLVCSASYIVSLRSFPNPQYFFCNTFQSTMRRVRGSNSRATLRWPTGLANPPLHLLGYSSKRMYVKPRGKKQTSQPRCKNSSRRNSFCFYKFKFIEKGANRQPYLLLEHTDPHFSVFMVPVSGVEPLPSGFSDRCCGPQVSYPGIY